MWLVKWLRKEPPNWFRFKNEARPTTNASPTTHDDSRLELRFGATEAFASSPHRKRVMEREPGTMVRGAKSANFFRRAEDRDLSKFSVEFPSAKVPVSTFLPFSPFS